jgi:ubiquinone/menaquinone biosynthesis C-methylase UbiE
MGTPRMEDLQQADKGRLYEGIEYQDFWVRDDRKKLHLLEQKLLRKLLPSSGRRILDLGCGYGRLANLYLDRFDEVVLLDGSMSLLREAKQVIGSRASYIAADINHLPFSGSCFDSILMMRVFHHIEDSARLLNSISAKLAGQGVLVFNYSNKINPKFISRWIRGKTKGNPITLDPAGVGSTFIQHHPRAVENMLHENGFSNIFYFGAGVFDKLPKMLIGGQASVNAGAITAPMLGRLRIAPWMICKATHELRPGEEFCARIEDSLICPACQSPLQSTQDMMACSGCSVQYPIEDGIFDLRIHSS